MFVVARTDSSDPDDIARRVDAFARAGADAVLVDGLKSLETIRQLASRIDKPFCFNQIAGGKSPPCTLSELQAAGVSIAIYSTPCLFAAQNAINEALMTLKARDGTLAGSPIGVRDCTSVLNDNLARVNSARSAAAR
jgi:2-methylisocitrate lyase-like PEP mutase family enzyme